MMKLLKRIFLPSETDDRVKAINDKSESILADTSKLAKRHSELLDKNGFTLQIYIASGGDHRGH